jgi:chorismate synthase
MTISVDMHAREPGKYAIVFDYSRREDTELKIVAWIMIGDNEGNEVTLYFRNPKQIQEFISSLTLILASQRFVELIAEGAK